MKETRKRLLGWFLTVAMTLSLTTGLMPVSASAEAKASDGDMVLNKTATLESDGTYTINLEAYATGKVTTTTETKPTDVVLLLDMSGSMDQPVGDVTADCYRRYTGKVKDMFHQTLYHACADGEYRVATPYRPSWDFGETGAGDWGFTCSCGDHRNWESPFNNVVEYDWYLYEKKDDVQSRLDALRTATESFVNIMAEKNAALEDEAQKNRLSIVKFAGDMSMETGDKVYTEGGIFGWGESTYNYTQIVKELTTLEGSAVGEFKGIIHRLWAAGATSADYGMNRAIAALGDLDDGREKVVILFTDGEPTHGNSFENSVAADTVNYAKSLKDAGVKVYTISTVDGSNPDDIQGNMNKYMNAVSSNYPGATATADRTFNVNFGDGHNQGYYKAAADADQLEDIFEELSSSIGGTTATLDANSVLRDVMGTGFDLSNATVTVTTADYLGDGEWATPVDSGIAGKISGNIVRVTGFDYSGNYVVDKEGTVETSGKKLIVTITGVEATDAAATDALISTNSDLSGIYATEDATNTQFTFPQPKTYIPSKTFVLDYGKAAVLDGWNTSEDNAGISYTTTAPTALDVNKMGKISNPATTDAIDTYGRVSLADETLTYTPGTMNWDGYDSFYVFGQWGDNKPTVDTGDNVWTRVNVVPANNVYYEDDFQNTTSGKLEIKYSEDDWETVGNTSDTYTQTVNDNNPYGWVETTDTTYSDGSAYATGTAGATATFTFTGTGVDVYSRTNMQSGTVYAKLSKEVNGEQVGQKMLIVDGQAVSNGDTGYYQIPTVFFSGLPYDTYTVTITVLTGAGTDGAATYYLDGIRVYNPVQEDDLVAAAYAEDGESRAMWYNVRDILIDSNDDTFEQSGAVFIDKIPNGNVNETSQIATYRDYGPKNEVYLTKGQKIAIPATDNGNYYIGLKAPDGSASAIVTNGTADTTAEILISTSADRYYKVVPSNGYIVIENNGKGLLAITKLRYTGGAEGQDGIAEEVDVVDLMNYVNTFDTLPVVAYAGQESTVETPEIVVEEEKNEYKSRVESWLEKLFSGASRWL